MHIACRLRTLQRGVVLAAISNYEYGYVKLTESAVVSQLVAKRVHTGRSAIQVCVFLGEGGGVLIFFEIFRTHNIQQLEWAHVESVNTAH